MPTQLRLPVQPAGAEEINETVAVLRHGGDVAYFAAGVPLFIHREDDAVGRRIAAVQMMELGLARQDELSAALEVNRTTLYRQHRKLKTAGVLGVVDQKRGPRGPHRFTADKRQRAEALLADGRSIRQAAHEVGVTEGTIRHALRRGDVRRAMERSPAPTMPAELGPRGRARGGARPGGGGGGPPPPMQLSSPSPAQRERGTEGVRVLGQFRGDRDWDRGMHRFDPGAKARYTASRAGCHGTS